eukprot:scaffold67058_cov35-Tisochrysis_lutea.AAC.3
MTDVSHVTLASSKAKRCVAAVAPSLNGESVAPRRQKREGCRSGKSVWLKVQSPFRQLHTLSMHSFLPAAPAAGAL